MRFLPPMIAVLCLLAPASLQAQGLPCAPRAQVLEHISRAEQTRRAMGQAGPAIMELFAAQDTEHWTLTVTLRDGRMCLLAQGTSFSLQDGTFPIPGKAS